MNAATKMVDQGKAADAFYLDFAKAFDKVPHERLMVKLEAKGISGDILRWIRNWLSNRTQRVRVKEAESATSDVDSGVPQGTVLGPPLFTIFIDDLDTAAEMVSILLKFADDTKGLMQMESEEDRRKLQQTLDDLCKWARSWGMQFNIKKCKIMHLGPGNPGHRYSMEGEELCEVEEERDIGVIVHKTLKPSRQCLRAANTATAVLRQISNNFHYRDRKHFLKLYGQYVRPHLEFAAPAWSPWLRTDMEKLESVQKKAVGMVSGLREKEYEGRLWELGMDSLETRRVMLDMSQVYRIIHGVDRVDLGGLFKKITQQGAAVTRRTADELNLETPRCRLDIRQKSFTVRVTEQWNRIDSKVKRLKTVKSFKNALKKPNQ